MAKTRTRSRWRAVTRLWTHADPVLRWVDRITLVAVGAVVPALALGVMWLSATDLADGMLAWSALLFLLISLRAWLLHRRQLLRLTTALTGGRGAAGLWQQACWALMQGDAALRLAYGKAAFATVLAVLWAGTVLMQGAAVLRHGVVLGSVVVFMVASRLSGRIDSGRLGPARRLPRERPEVSGRRRAMELFWVVLVLAAAAALLVLVCFGPNDTGAWVGGLVGAMAAAALLLASAALPRAFQRRSDTRLNRQQRMIRYRKLRRLHSGLQGERLAEPARRADNPRVRRPAP